MCDSIYQSRNSELSDSTSIPLTIPDLPKSYPTSRIRTLLSIFHSNYPKNELSQLNRLDSLYYELYYISISDKQETGEGFTRDGWARDLIDYHCLKRGKDVLKIIWKFRNDEISSFRACFRESEDWNINNIKPPLSVTDNDSVDYNKHKVYAPPTILEYYEISRTWLCHIYSYYSLPSKSLKYIKSVHYTNKNIKIVDVGCGTGYSLKVINENCGLEIEGYDLKGFNEYHGDIIPWVTINYSCFNGKADIMILGYPPPDTEMGEEMIERFEGEEVWFIGEFRGLTGTRKFERELRRWGRCVYGERCLGSGEDCAKLTVWKKRKEEEVEVEPEVEPLQCVVCKMKVATMRCRLNRTWECCGWECVEKEGMEEKIRKKGIPVDVGRRRDVWMEIDEL
ncbi:hypothetical protein TL16_g08677 [Triparma laevis f. inornata]|uniref:S-adenosyl-L-methionine-dependent methyltransferase n=2 Tax=Triparma laevis TaxID=1534972 RepID=A0A9W7AZ41_9STRA|nr:hypothetical protein TL16_g08677 [Triparma laevis f. inornata]